MITDLTETKDFLTEYLNLAPVSFALARAIECRILSTLDFQPPILDLGCGDGLFAQMFFGTRVVDAGIDLSLEELRLASRRKTHRYLSVGKAGDLPFPEKTFNTVLCNSVLEHIPDLERALNDISRVLTPQGRLIATVPAAALSDHFFYTRALRKLGLPRLARVYATQKNRLWRHYHMYNDEEWKLRVDRSGLVMEKCLPFLPPRAVELCDLFYPLSAPAPLIKRTTGSLSFRPQWLTHLLAKALRRVYETDAATGGSLCIVARRE